MEEMGLREHSSGESLILLLLLCYHFDVNITGVAGLVFMARSAFAVHITAPLALQPNSKKVTTIFKK